MTREDGADRARRWRRRVGTSVSGGEGQWRRRRCSRTRLGSGEWIPTDGFVAAGAGVAAVLGCEAVGTRGGTENRVRGLGRAAPGQSEAWEPRR
jgi:hypothetical protein